MPLIDTVFVDMDGTVADFVGGCAAWFGQPHPFKDGKKPGTWDFFEQWGIPCNTFWQGIDSVRFWETLPVTHDARGMMNVLLDNFLPSQICFLTGNKITANAVEGKKRWAKKHFGAHNILFAQQGYTARNPKSHCAAPGHLLVDDLWDNCVAWRDAGGRAFQVSRPWNQAEVDIESSNARVLDDLLHFNRTFNQEPVQ